LGNIHMKLSL